VTFAVFQWLERTPLSVSINESLWAFAVVEAMRWLQLAWKAARRIGAFLS